MAGAATLRINIVTDARGTQTAIAQTDSSLGKLGQTASKAGALLKIGLAGAAAGALVLGKQAYDAASAVEQSFGALDSIYGKHSGLVKDLAKSAAQDVGLAKSQYADLAAVLGAQLTNMGRSQQQAANETENLIRMGADLSATFGGSVADAVNAVSSALKGETDPIERYGVSVKAADISARLAAQGLGDLEGAALKQATATAVLGMITDQTAKSQGAFAREGDTAAGQQARLAANVENLKARLGAGLLPVMAATFEYINTRVIPGASAFAATLSEELGPTISQIANFIQTKLIPGARAIVEWFVEKIVPNIRSAVLPILTQLKASFGGVADTLDKNSGNLQTLAKFVGNVIEVISKLAPIVGKIIVTNLKLMSAAVETVITVVSTLVGWIDSAVQKVKELADAITGNPIVKGAGKLLGAVNPFAAGPIAGSVGRLVGQTAPLGSTAGLTTAALGGFGGSYSAGYSRSGSAAPAIVDARRYYSFDLGGAIDPIATADRVKAVLRADEVRKGSAATFVPANGWVG